MEMNRRFRFFSRLSILIVDYVTNRNRVQELKWYKMNGINGIKYQVFYNDQNKY